LAYFQGVLREGECADQRLLRGIIPENRLRVYDVRTVIETLADTGTVLELRRHFGLGMVTALTRPPGSCNFATPSTSRSCSCATRPASWSARRSRRRRWCATPRGCS